MAKVAIKGASYVMVHAPDLLIHNGSTQVGARLENPEHEYLKALPKHLRNFEAHWKFLTPTSHQHQLERK